VHAKDQVKRSYSVVLEHTLIMSTLHHTKPNYPMLRQ